MAKELQSKVPEPTTASKPKQLKETTTEHSNHTIFYPQNISHSHKEEKKMLNEFFHEDLQPELEKLEFEKKFATKLDVEKYFGNKFMVFENLFLNKMKELDQKIEKLHKSNKKIVYINT